MVVFQCKQRITVVNSELDNMSRNGSFMFNNNRSMVSNHPSFTYPAGNPNFSFTMDGNIPGGPPSGINTSGRQ